MVPSLPGLPPGPVLAHPRVQPVVEPQVENSNPSNKKFNPSATHRIKKFLEEIAGANYSVYFKIVNDPHGPIQITVYAPPPPLAKQVFFV
jgi:hypothetical protein